MKKAQSISEGNKELRVESPTTQSELRLSTSTIRAPKIYSPSFHYLLLTESGEPECYEEALEVKAKRKWDEIESLMKNQTWGLVELRIAKKHAQE